MWCFFVVVVFVVCQVTKLCQHFFVSLFLPLTGCYFFVKVPKWHFFFLAESAPLCFPLCNKHLLPDLSLFFLLFLQFHCFYSLLSPPFLNSFLVFFIPSVFSLTLSEVAIDKGDPDMVEALVGQTVVLPCRVRPPPSSTVTIEWRRDGVAVSSRRCAFWHMLSLTHSSTDWFNYSVFTLTSGTINSLTVPCCSALWPNQTLVGFCV